MDKIKKIITKINEPLTSFNFINTLGILFWLLLAISLVSVPLIYFYDKPVWLLSSQGFNNLLDIYKFPFYLIAASLAVITLRITIIRSNQTYEQIESSYRPILYLTSEKIDFQSRKENNLGEFNFLSQGTGSLPHIKINNVGLAVARELHLRFEYDYEEIIRILGISDISNQLKIDESDESIQLREDQFYIGLEPPDKAYAYINFLIPTSEGYEFILPKDYLNLFIIYGTLVYNEIANLSLKEAQITYYKLIDSFPKLKLFISYKDLGNKLTVKNYDFQFRDLLHVFGPPINNGKFIERKNILTVIPIEIKDNKLGNRVNNF